MSGLALVEVLSSIVPVLFALAAGLVIREVKAVFDGTPGHQTTLAIVLAGIVGLMLIETLTTIARRYITARLTDDLRYSLSLELAEHFSSVDLAFFEDREGQNMIERAGGQPGSDMVQFVLTAARILTQGFQAITLAGVLIFIEPVFTPIVVLVSIPLLMFRWHMAKLTYKTRRQQSTIRRWTGYYMNTLTSREFVPTVKIYKLAPILIRQFAAYLGEIIHVNRRLYHTQAIGSAVASTAVTLAALGLVVWVGYRTVSGEVSIELFGTFVVAVNRIQASIQMFVDSVAAGLEKILFISNLSELLQQKPHIQDGARKPTEVIGSIELKDVHFRYPGTTEPVIKGVNMILEAGQTVALLGPNGCGKTTLARLIARLHDVDQGRVLIDGQDIREFSISDLYDNIAFVSQRPVCFEATAEENIAYGDWARFAEAPDKIRQVAKDASIAGMIEGLPDGYKTPIGRRFGNFDLSVGQWQKLAMARALARNAPILILDEPTASMDVHSEEEMYSGFQKLAAGKTTLLISHRFSTVAMADHIYIMDDGRIVDNGSHEELLRRGGIYSAMYELHNRVSDRQSRKKT
jgi:ATP-binding cassette subfamily B protein